MIQEKRVSTVDEEFGHAANNGLSIGQRLPPESNFNTSLYFQTPSNSDTVLGTSSFLPENTISSGTETQNH